MRRGLILILVVFFAVGVLAMDDPITVKTEPGNHVKLYAWTAGGGPLLTMKNDTVDSSGVFETTFFTLNQKVVTFHVMIIGAKDVKLKDQRFFNQKTDGPLTIDCTGSGNCTIAETVAGDVVENESVEEDVVEEVIDNSSESSSTVNSSFSGNQVKSSSKTDEENNNLFWYLLGGVLTLIVLLVAYFRFASFRDFLTGLNYFSEEGELVRIKHDIQRKDRLIEKVKEKKFIEAKLRIARAELARENKKLEKMVRKELKEVNKRKGL